MKSKFYLIILLILSAGSGIAQSNRIIGVNEYDQLKKAGQLPEKFLMQKTEGNETVIMPRIHPSANTVQSTATCNCLIPLDTTFTVVPFTNDTAPYFRNDDGSSPVIPLPFSFCFSGQIFSSVYINNNGNISFIGPYNTFSPSGFPDPNYVMVAPFWGDVDTRIDTNGTTASGLVYYKLTATALIVKWEHVGYYWVHSDKLNTFQLIISDGNDPLIPGGNVAFCYGDMQWTTGDASMGINGFGGVPATAGANLGNGIDYIQFGRFDQPGYGFDGAFNSNDSVDWLDSSSFVFDLCTTNTPPVPFDCNSDTVYLRVNDTMAIDVSFFDPNFGQITSIAVNGGGLVNLTTVSNTSGSLARYQGSLIASATNLGFNTVTLSAADNITPGQVTMSRRIIHIDQLTGIENAQPSLFTSFSPNPFTEQTTFTMSGANGRNITLSISDVTGREVMHVDDVPPTLTIEKGNLSKGIYLYRLNDGGNLKETGKIIIQ